MGSEALVIRGAAQLVCVAHPGESVRRGLAMRAPVVIEDGAVLVRDGRVEWVGPTRDLPPVPAGAAVIDATGKTVLPGLVDSHTHLVFAGTREDEFGQRLQGTTYQEVAARGGGINATVRRVRQASRA